MQEAALGSQRLALCILGLVTSPLWTLSGLVKDSMSGSISNRNLVMSCYLPISCDVYSRSL